MSSPQITPAATEFIQSVLRLSPRVAVFDADGTLWSPDAGEQFFYWEIENRVIPDAVARWAVPRYEDYRRGLIAESEMCGEMVTIHAGLKAGDVGRAAERFFGERIEAKVFPEMQQLISRLRDAHCELWIVSSTNEWVVRAGMLRFGIAGDHVLAAAVAIDDGVVTKRLLRVPTDQDKAAVVKQVLGAPPDAAFGNSMHDLAMLNLAKNAFVVNPNPDLQTIAQRRGWPVYQPCAVNGE